MERSAMRGRGSRITPRCARLHPGYILALAFVLLAAPAGAAEAFKLAIGQRGLWDSAIAEIGTEAGIFARHGIELQTFYTSGGGETQQAVISASSDIGVSAGTLGVLGAFAKGAPVRIIAGEATGTAEYYFVRAESPVRTMRDIKPAMTFAYSTNGSGTHITALRFLKEYGIEAKLVATGSVPATFTQVMSGQIEVGFSTPPFGLDAANEGRIRIIATANDLASVRSQTVRVTIANANDLKRRRGAYRAFIAAYRETIDWMYADPRAIAAFAPLRANTRGNGADRARPVLSENDAAARSGGGDRRPHGGWRRVQIHPAGAQPRAARRAAAAARAVIERPFSVMVQARLASDSSCPAKAGHPVNTDHHISDRPVFTGSSAFADDDESCA
jgi:NitT/TauT family transport system substrate-binding protein